MVRLSSTRARTLLLVLELPMLMGNTLQPLSYTHQSFQTSKTELHNGANFDRSIIMIIGVVLQSIGVNIQMFIAARFLIGFGVAIAHGAAPLLITELVHPQHRAIFTTIYNSTWYLGSIVAAWLTYGTFSILNAWSWRIPSLVQAAPSVIQLCAIWYVPITLPPHYNAH